MSFRRKLLRRLGWLTILVLLAASVRFYFNGRNLALLIASEINKRVLGHIYIESVEWPPSGIFSARLPFDVRGIRVYDPRGHRALYVEHATGTISWLDLFTKWPPFTVRHMQNLHVESGECLVKDYGVGEEEPQIGLLESFAGRDQPPHLPGETEPPRDFFPITELESLDLSGVDLTLEMRPFRLEMHGIKTRGWLKDVGDPLKFSFMLAPTVERAALDIHKPPLHFDLVNVNARRFGQYREKRDELAFHARARTVEGARIDIEGALTNLHDPRAHAGGVNFLMAFYDGGKLLERLSKGLFGGDVTGIWRVSGRMSYPTFEVSARGIDAMTLPFPAHVDHIDGTWNLLSGVADVRELEVRALGGAAVGKAVFHIDGRTVVGTVDIPQAMDVGKFLPPEVREIAGGTRLSGHVGIQGLIAFNLLAKPVDLRLGQARVRGRARLRGDEILTDGLELTVPGGKATVKGRIQPLKRSMNIELEAGTEELASILKRLNLPPIATGMDAKVHLGGSLESPTVSAEAVLRGVPLTPKVALSLDYRKSDGHVSIKRLDADTLGGSLSGSAELVLPGKGRDVRIVSAQARGEKLDLARLPLAPGVLSGKARLEVTASGTTARPIVSARVAAEDVTASGFPVGKAAAELALDEGGLEVKSLHVGADGTGTLDVAGRVGLDRAHGMGLDVDLKDVPVALLPFLRDQKSWNLAGRVSLKAHVGGTLDRPAVSGRLSLRAFAFQETILGNADLDLEPTSDGKLHVRGQLFQDKLGVDAIVSLAGLTRGAPASTIDVSARIALRRVDLEEFFPELAASIGAHGWVTGYLDVQTQPALRATAHLSEVRIAIDSSDEEGRPQPVIIENHGEIVVAWDGLQKRATIVSPIRMASENAEFELPAGGWAGPTGLNLAVKGEVQIALAAIYLARLLPDLRGNLKSRGDVDVDVSLTGTPEKPKLLGSIAFDNVGLQLPGQDAEVTVPSGQIFLSNDQIRIQDVKVTIDGQTLDLAATVKLVSFRPADLDVSVHGRLAGKLLKMLSPVLFIDAGGSAQVDLAVSGEARRPVLAGSLTFEPHSAFSFSPRNLRRQVYLDSGKVAFSNQQLSIENIQGRVGDGPISLAGMIRLKGFKIDSADAHATLRNFNYTIPQVLTMELAADVDASYVAGGLRLSGELDIIDGRFFQELVRLGERLVPVRTEERSQPFWKGNPLLANTVLALSVKTTGNFQVKNDLANVSLRGGVRLTGTPEQPSLDGVIQVGEGTISIPWLRIPYFTVRSGSVSFSPYRTLPDDTPYIDLKADSPFQDIQQNDYIVYLTFQGTLTGFEWDVNTNTGLSKSQTVVLIGTGRTEEQLRGKAGAQTGGSESSNAELGRTPNAAGDTNAIVALSDEIVKQFTGDFIDILIEEPLRKALNLDCVRLGIGTESLQLEVCKNFSRSLTANGKYEQGFRGWSRTNLSLDYKAADNIFFVVKGLRRVPELASEEIETSGRLQLNFRFVIP